jgi:hypothetical protein
MNYDFEQFEKTLNYHRKISGIIITPKLLRYVLENPDILREKISKHIELKNEILTDSELNIDTKEIYMDEVDRSLRYLTSGLILKLKDDDSKNSEKILSLIGAYGLGLLSGGIIGCVGTAKFYEFLENFSSKVSESTAAELLKNLFEKGYMNIPLPIQSNQQNQEQRSKINELFKNILEKSKNDS